MSLGKDPKKGTEKGFANVPAEMPVAAAIKQETQQLPPRKRRSPLVPSHVNRLRTSDYTPLVMPDLK